MRGYKVRSEFEYQTNDSTLKEFHASLNKEIKVFSDCLVISIPLNSNMTEIDGTFDPIMSEIVSFAYAQCESIFAGHFLRGAIDIGWWYSNEDIIISPALANAYELEKEANMPVIALSDQVSEYFERHSDRKFYSEDCDPIPSTFRSYSETKKGVSKYFIDYMSICLRSLGFLTSKEQREEYKISTSERRGKIIDEGYRNNIHVWLTRHKESILVARRKLIFPANPGHKVKHFVSLRMSLD